MSTQKDSHIITIRKMQECDGCGRKLPKGSKMTRWKVWVDGQEVRVRFCSDCAVVSECEARRPLDLKHDIYTYMFREICERCDEFPMCSKADHIRESEVGQVWFGDFDD